MFEIQITVACPDLVAAATTLANALAGIKPISNPDAPAGTGDKTPAPVAPAPLNQTGYSPTPVLPAGYYPHAAAITPAPVAQAPAFTLEQVSKAGADLITAQPAKMQDLMALLQQYGVQTIQALPADKLGTFATALRGMGAQI